MDTFLTLPPPFNMIVIIVAIVFSVELLKSLFKQIRRFADNEADRRLRRELVESGMSVEEAEQWAAIRFDRTAKDQPIPKDQQATQHYAKS